MAVPTKLILGAIILLGITVYLAYLGASSSWQYYLTVDECSADMLHFAGRRVRISGLVSPGSLRIRDDRNLATFELQGSLSTLTTVCRGPLPDNLAEDIAVVVEGTVRPDRSIDAEKVLTRCASKYESQH